jgi:gluconolactonase
MHQFLRAFIILGALVSSICSAQQIVALDPGMEQLVPAGSRIEMIGEGFHWLEGPVWDRKENRLLFSEIPTNTAWQWTREGGSSVFLKPSGHTGIAPPTGVELGSNGLAFDHEGRLLVCEQGDRRLTRLEKDGSKTTLADRFEGNRLNSPNDLVVLKDGSILFTDPPYGLPKGFSNPLRELPYCGVFRLSPDGTLTLLTKEMSAPNGIAISPDEKYMYIANSDSKRAVVARFELKEDGKIGEQMVLLDATAFAGKKPGLPDGLKVDARGNLFVTGPGGIYVVSPEGKHLGTIEFDAAVSNCGWGEDGSTLFATVTSKVYRIETTTKGAGW